MNNVILDRDPETEEKKINRPVVVTIACVLEFISMALIIAYVLYQVVMGKRLSTSIFFIYTVVWSIFKCVLATGVWYMRRWAALTLIAAIAINQAVLMYTYRWSIDSVIVPGLIAFLIAIYIGKMK